MSDTKRIAVIGAGFMGSMHASIFARLRGCELAAIVDPNTALATGVADKLGGAKVYASHDELLANERLDLISICTPDNLHLAPALAAAEKGVNLFIEKPIASSLDEARQIVDACRKAGTKLGIGYLLRFDPRYAHAKELIATGRTGAPIHLYARRNSARTEGPKRYAGKLPLALHVTVHDVDLALWMLEGQKPVTVYAQETDRLLGPIGTQDTIAAIVRFSDGTVVNFESAWSLPSGARHMIDARLEFIGTEGSFEIQCGDSGLYFADNERSQEIDTQHWPIVGGRVEGDLKRELEGVIDWLDGGNSPVATGEEAIASLELTLAMIRSAETDEVVRLS
ncbi:Gfo/Idh/MocA family protein [Aureimonas jatrophae]|uniref:Myo-inositol 2-dehydrogenase / D-chiro-inositol 1-dehydrogenase/UDP-N-acetylglucosamine 3-dehydrogenase n=1 Tax=Aureimonas jatrophae TaxID=1166073 RepID=A0A1H0MMF3_9HYPH|nr:Gfo/Idh/MocA family oxidoreductase [Aureimonas jatrophae]MBB3952889.1 putative dehydrogenase [Aureimonas jatrophae]SDO81514.1 myo-inositol 2-dehydrogenase / D-chiro-inositol 1-dehydrogenase/UDP-N-acetylglucosamine 3-dehydrogenase [Aureimonas jatrophae]